MTDQPQSIKDCAALRQECRSTIFEKMDNQHTETMEAIANLRVELAKQGHFRPRRINIKDVISVLIAALVGAGAAIGVAWKAIHGGQ